MDQCGDHSRSFIFIDIWQQPRSRHKFFCYFLNTSFSHVTFDFLIAFGFGLTLIISHPPSPSTPKTHKNWISIHAVDDGHRSLITIKHHVDISAWLKVQKNHQASINIVVIADWFLLCVKQDSWSSRSKLWCIDGELIQWKPIEPLPNVDQTIKNLLTINKTQTFENF